MALPADLPTRTFADDFYDLLGRPNRGTVTFTANQVVTELADGPTLLPIPVVVPLDTNGHLQVTLPVTDSPAYSAGLAYTVSFQLVGTGVTPIAQQPAPYVLTVESSLPTGLLRLRTKTAYGSAFGPSVDFHGRTVADDFLDIAGNPAAGYVSFLPSQVLTHTNDGPTLTPVEVDVPLDATGHLEVFLPLSDDVNYQGSNTYAVTFHLLDSLAIPLVAQPVPYTLQVPSALPNVKLRLRTQQAYGFTLIDNGNGTFTASGAAVTDNGNGTFSILAPPAVDNGNGTFTLTA